MDDGEVRQPETAQPPATVGTSLRLAREGKGLSLADVAAQTRIPLRHLVAIEQGDYSALPSPTYAVGFAKGYARAIGADEVAVAHAVRAEVDRAGPRVPEYIPYEAPDPARVPSRGIAIVGLGLALAILILGSLWYGTSLFSGGGTDYGLPLGGPKPGTKIVTPIAAPKPTPAAPTGGQVVLTASDDVWMRVYDADNKTLYLGTMKPGEAFTVPAAAKDPMINVGRPDKLTVTLDGKAVPPLGTGEHAIKDVKVGGTAIAARLTGGATTPAPDASSTPQSSAHRSSDTHRDGKAGKSHKAPLTETQRANIDSAAHPPAATGNISAP
ncbi:helix-turn-helix domain-containing protein [Sphingomonas bacterium]|uniref:helix-turn-helix domain-containing protein n=1 Tax=Sphingomonas bacterium TaxID=1895847 RepID=UPI0015752255|nr:helix-turn-helix domain-containing protein [Sphingomonas bacterium]